MAVIVNNMNLYLQARVLDVKVYILVVFLTNFRQIEFFVYIRRVFSNVSEYSRII